MPKDAAPAKASHIPKAMTKDELQQLQRMEDKEAGIRARAAVKDKNKHLQIERHMNLIDTYAVSRKLVLAHKDPALAEAHLQSVIAGVHLMDR